MDAAVSCITFGPHTGFPCIPRVTRVYASDGTENATVDACFAVLCAAVFKRPDILRGLPRVHNGVLSTGRRGVWLLSFDLGRTVTACAALKARGHFVRVKHLAALFTAQRDDNDGAMRIGAFLPCGGQAEDAVSASPQVAAYLARMDIAHQLCVRCEFAFNDEADVRGFDLVTSTRYESRAKIEARVAQTPGSEMCINTLYTPEAAALQVPQAAAQLLCIAFGDARTARALGCDFSREPEPGDEAPLVAAVRRAQGNKAMLCVGCGVAPGDVPHQRCEGCNVLRYCSRACHREHWRRAHRCQCALFSRVVSDVIDADDAL